MFVCISITSSISTFLLVSSCTRLTDHPKSTEVILDGLLDCVRRGVAGEIERANEEVAFQAEIRKKMADSWENYTCANNNANITEPSREYAM